MARDYGNSATLMKEASDMEPEITLSRPIVLVGMMGAGKSAIGKWLADRLGVSFVDADAEIEAAAGMTIEEIFATLGEPEFRRGEREVIRRLLAGPPGIIATGGGAWMDPETRRAVAERGISIWLRADFSVLWARVSRRTHRPLLKNADPQGTLQRLMETRYPVYAEADVTIESDNGPKEATGQRVLDAIASLFHEKEVAT